MPRNTLRSRLHRGEVVGVVSGLHSTDMVDWLGQFRPDAIWMECEHGPGSWDEIGDFSRACDLWECASIVRVMNGDAATITRTLDRGASGIVVPHVNTRAQAQAIATASRFGPHGLRGMYGSRRSYGVANPLADANEEVVTVILIEEAQAIANLEEILTVEGIDVFFVAPSDLAQTMGHTGNPGHPDVQSTIDRALARIREAGRVSGTLVTEANRDRYLDLGVQFAMTSWLPWVQIGLKSFQHSLTARNACIGKPNMS
jgi:4-hydroxy-2-oxoheptanedioate aldolase